MRFGKEIITRYLLPYSTYRVSSSAISTDVIKLLIYALQLDEAVELLQYCQDMCIEMCRPLWRSYMKYDRVNFNQYLVSYCESRVKPGRNSVFFNFAAYSLLYTFAFTISYIENL